MTTKKPRIEKIRNSLDLFKQTRERHKEEEVTISDQQQELIALMRGVDPDNNGIIVDPDDSKGTAFVQQNEGSLVWDDEQIMTWLLQDVPGRRKTYLFVTSRVLDIQKWEAAVAAGDVPKKVAKRMQKRLDPPKPFIRWGKKKRGKSL